MTSRSTWQRHERHIARQFGAQRAPLGVAGADVVTGAYSIECKAWQRLPAKVLAALQQAERSATSNQVALAIIHETGQRRADDLVIMRMATFERLIGDDN